MIHGDFNEQNILVSKNTSDNDYHISAVIDFGDMNKSHYVFEAAIATMYMMVESKVRVIHFMFKHCYFHGNLKVV